MSFSWPDDAKVIIHRVACKNGGQESPIRAANLAGLMFQDAEFRPLLDRHGVDEGGCFFEILTRADTPSEPVGSRFYLLDAASRVILTRACAPVGAAPALAARDAAPEAEPASDLPRTIRQAMRDVLSGGPLAPTELAAAVTQRLIDGGKIDPPGSPLDQMVLCQDIGIKITKTIDGEEFQLMIVGADANKIRYVPTANNA